MPQRCCGRIKSHDPNLILQLDTVMYTHGFTTAIGSSSLCHLYERYDATLLCKSSLYYCFRDKYQYGFNLGGQSIEALKKVINHIEAEASLKVEVNRWQPALSV